MDRYKWAESVTSQWRTMEVVPSDATWVTVHGLQSSSTYLITVLARTVSSQPTSGQFSNVVDASTKGLSANILSEVEEVVSSSSGSSSSSSNKNNIGRCRMCGRNYADLS